MPVACGKTPLVLDIMEVVYHYLLSLFSVAFVCTCVFRLAMNRFYVGNNKPVSNPFPTEAEQRRDKPVEQSMLNSINRSSEIVETETDETKGENFHNSTPSDGSDCSAENEEFEVLTGNGSIDIEDSRTSPIPLLEEVDGTLTFQSDNLRKLLDPKILDGKPVAIVSIAGALRMGKSFLLSLLLTYLQNEGWKSKKWLDDWNSTKFAGLWRGGSEAHTRGILAWGKPILIKTFDRRPQEIAVILLDTQGNFEHGRSTQENISVFALSTLFSSLQIFNVSKQLQTNDLQYLQCFVEFAKMMMSDSSESSGSNVDSGMIHRHQFQNLAYLVRDWPHPHDHGYGENGGKEYLAKFMSVEKGTENQIDVQKYLKEAFKTLSCFLMPEPGPDVRISRKKYKDLTAKDLGDDFCDYIHLFAEAYLNPHKIQYKRIAHVPCYNPEYLIRYMETCAAALTDCNLDEVPNLMALCAEHVCIMAIDKAERSFQANLKKDIDEMEDPEWEKFESLAKEEIETTVDHFLYDTKYGRNSDNLEGVQRLKDQLRRLQQIELKEYMHRKRTGFVKKEAGGWLNNSKDMIKKRCRYWFTDTKDLKIAQNDCLKRLMEKDAEDCERVKIVLEDARNELENFAQEFIEEENDKNWEKLKYAGKAIGVGALATVPFAGIAAFSGSLLIMGLTSAGSGGLYLKNRLDSLCHTQTYFKKND